VIWRTDCPSRATIRLIVSDRFSGRCCTPDRAVKEIPVFPGVESSESGDAGKSLHRGREKL